MGIRRDSRRCSRRLKALCRHVLLASAFLRPVGAADVPPESPPVTVIDAAVERGLDWLATAQQPDGAWGSGTFRGSAAVTAQVVMAGIMAGNTPASGRHSAAIARAVAYLADCAGGDGLIAGNEQAAHGPMYAHAFATTALAEVYGESTDERLAKILQASRGLIDATQNEEGGWRYQPQRRDADLSVTAAMLVALKALHDSGFEVSADTVERAASFLSQLQNEDGGFRYLTAAGPSGAPRTAAALFALQVAGQRGEHVARGFAWLDAHPVTLGGGDGYTLYGLSYEAAARRQWQAHGTEDAARFEQWCGAVSTRLLASQRDDGSWTDPSCPEYGTAAAITILTMPVGLAPLFQPSATASPGDQP